MKMKENWKSSILFTQKENKEIRSREYDADFMKNSFYLGNSQTCGKSFKNL